MKKVLAVLVAVVMVFGVAVPAALAASTEDEVTVVITPGDTTNEDQTPTPDPADEEEATDETDTTEDEATDETEEDNADDDEKILTPDSPFYFLKRFVESVKLFLTFDEEKKVQLLSELAEERAKELEALQEQYADGELTDAQFELLEKALDDLVLSTERLVNSLVPAEEDDNTDENDEATDEEDDEVTDEDDDEATDENDDEATDEDDDEATDEDDDEATDEDDDEATDEDDDEATNEDEYADKYLRRVAHLQRIADNAPEAAQNGLARAIQNALRQRERAIAKGKIDGDPVEDNEEDEGTDEGTTEEDAAEDEDETIAPPVEETDETTETETATVEATDTDEIDARGKKDKPKKDKDNNGRKPDKTGPGKGKGK